MANVNIRTPRFYVDYINFLTSRGTGSHYNIQTNNTGGEQIAISSGTVDELFDMRPLNQVTFDTSGNTDGHVNLWFDLKTSGFRVDFVAILNHNMHRADAKVRISSSDGRDTNDDGTIDVDGDDYVKSVDHHNSSSSTNATGANLSRVIGVPADSTSGGHQQTGIVNNLATADNASSWGTGHTIITFTEETDRYWGIQFEGTNGQTSVSHANGTFDGTHDLKIGCILLGQFYDMPRSPDLSVKRKIEFDGVNVQESIGGQRFSNIKQFGRRNIADDNKSPFHTYYNSFGAYGGRMAYDMKFSFLNSTDIMPNNYNEFQPSDEAIIEDLWNKTNGRHLPFIFTQDKSSTDYSDYLFARFAQDSLSMTQVAPDVFDVALKIEEEF